MLSRVCASTSLHPSPPTHRHAHTAAANPSRSRTRLCGFHLPLIPCCYPVGMRLCNTWVLSCQHHLQILACRGADESVWGEADEYVRVFFYYSQSLLIRLRIPSDSVVVSLWQCARNMLQCTMHTTWYRTMSGLFWHVMLFSYFSSVVRYLKCIYRGNLYSPKVAVRGTRLLHMSDFSHHDSCFKTKSWVHCEIELVLP